MAGDLGTSPQGNSVIFLWMEFGRPAPDFWVVSSGVFQADSKILLFHKPNSIEYTLDVYYWIYPMIGLITF